MSRVSSWPDPSPCRLLPRRRSRALAATSRQEPWPNMSHKLLMKRDAQNHPSPLPCRHSPPPAGRGWFLAALWCRQHRQHEAPCGLFLSSETMGWPCQGAVCPSGAVCLSAQLRDGGDHPDCWLTETWTTWASKRRVAPLAGMQPGCSQDAIPPPPLAMGLGWGHQGPLARTQAVQQPCTTMLGHIIAPPLWAVEQPAPGRQAGSVPDRHAPVSLGSSAPLCPFLGKSGRP